MSDAAGFEPGDFRRERWVLRWKAWLWVPLAAQLLTIAGPFVLDDLYMIRRIERYRAGELSQPGLFHFFESDAATQAQRDRTSCPWWIGGGGTTKFFRPLPEGLMLLDYALFGRRAPLHRAVSLGWLVLALLLVHRMYLEAGAAPVKAAWATLTFGVAQSVVTPAAFVSNRSDLMVVVGVAMATIALFCNQRCANGRWRWYALAVGAYAFALCSKESAAPLALVWIGYWLLERRRGAPGVAQARAAGGVRLRTAALGAMVLGAYLLYYVGNGYGARSAYATVWESLSELAAKAPRAVFQILPIWMLGVPGVLFDLTGQWALEVAVGLAGLWLAALVLRLVCRLWRGSAPLRFFAVWMVMFSLLAVIATSEPRVLCVATVGWAYCFAEAVVRRPPDEPRTAYLTREWLMFANGTLTLCMGLGMLLYAYRNEALCQQRIRDYLAELGGPLQEGDALVVTQPRHLLELFTPGDRLQYLTGLRDVRLHYLTVPGVPNVRRVALDAHSLRLSSPSPLLFGSRFHPRRGEDGQPLHVGTRFRNRDFTAQIAEMDAGVVTALELRFAVPLNDRRLWFVPPLP